MSDVINVKIPKKLAQRIKKIAKEKFQLREIKFFSDAVNEALVEWGNDNSDFAKKVNKKSAEVSS